MRREDTERGSRFRGVKGRKNTCFLLYSFGTADYNENTEADVRSNNMKMVKGKGAA